MAFIFVYSVDQTTSSRDFLLNTIWNKKYKGAIDSKIRPYSLGGLSGITTSEVPNSGVYSIEDIILKRSSNIYWISYGSQSVSREVWDQILSTFRFSPLTTSKFLDQNSEAERCQVCGPQGLHNVEGKSCPTGLVCKSGLTTSVSYCIETNESVVNCEK